MLIISILGLHIKYYLVIRNTNIKMSATISGKYRNGMENVHSCPVTPHAFMEICTHLTQKDITSLMLTCKYFRELVSCQHVDIEIVLIRKSLYECSIISSHILKKLEHIRSMGHDGGTRTRFSYLEKTITDSMIYFNFQLESETWKSYAEKNVMIGLIETYLRQLSEIEIVLDNFIAGTYKMTVNFDILEISIRRINTETGRLFPMDERKYDIIFSNHIKDVFARDVWNEVFGEKCAGVSFFRFNEKIMGTWDLDDDKIQMMQKCVSHLFNIPHNNIMTVYKFNSLVQLYGPYNKIAENIHKFVLTPECGFGGLLNTIGATEILKYAQPFSSKLLILIRFSRCDPELFSFSYINSEGLVEHVRNITADGDILSITTMLEKYRYHQLARIHIDPQLFGITNTVSIATQTTYQVCSGYNFR